MKKIIIFVCVLMIGGQANAELFDRGGGMVYDSDQNITWVKDVDLPKTLGDDDDGRMTWQDAKDWADNLEYRGYSDWRLPKFRDELTVKPGCDTYASLTYDNSDCGFNTDASLSELAYLFHNVLGNISMRDRNGVYGQCPTSGTYCLVNNESNGVTFDNLSSVDTFWTDTYVPSINEVIWFSYTYGIQSDADYATGIASVWVVRDGDSSIADPVFDFNDIVDAPVNTYTSTNTVTLTGIHRQLPISITGGSYKINDGAWTTSTGVVDENDQVTLRILSSSQLGATTSATVTIGNTTDVANVTTIAPDNTPEPFFLNDANNAELSTIYRSNVITVRGINAPTAISVVDGEYAVNGGAWTSAAGSVVEGDTFIVRRLSSAEYSTTVSAVLTVGTFSDSFDITTKEFVADTKPDPFSFNNISNAEPSTSYLSNTITVTGINAPAFITLPSSSAQAEYRINGGAWTTASGSVEAGDVVQLRGISGPDYGGYVYATLGIGGEQATFYIFNRDLITNVNAFDLTNVTNADPSTYYSSNTITVSGPEVAVAISITEGQYRINGGAWTSVAGTVEAGDTVMVRNLSSENFLTTNSTLLTIGNKSSWFLITTRGPINIADPFSFVDVTNAELSTLYTSNTITVSGPEVATGLSVSGGEYSKNGGAWISAFSQVDDVTIEGDTIRVRRSSSAEFDTTVSVEVTIGSQTDSFDITTKSADSTPNAFSFVDVTNAELDTSYTSNTVTINGINISSPVSIVGGQYRVNGGSWTATAGSVLEGDVIEVRRNSSSAFSTAVAATLTVGTVSDAFDITTKAADTIPNSFSFIDVTNAEVNTSYTSNTVTISGINTSSPVSIVGGQYRVNGGSWMTAAGSVVEGDVIEVRRNSSSAFSTAVAATLTVGTVSDAFDITTRAAVNNVDVFSFVDKTNAELNTSYTSNSITVSGPEQAVSISIVSGQYSVNGGAWTSAAGTVDAGDTVAVRRNSASAYETSVSTTLTIGGTSDAFDITTIAADITPNAFSFIDVTDAEVNTSYTSNSVTITGINTTTSVSIVDGEYRVNGGAWTSVAGTVVDGDVVEVRRNSATEFSTAVAATLTVGTYSDAFDITTKAQDITPNAFSFIDVTDAEVSTSYTSNAVTITGINTATAVSIVGGEYRVNGGTWTSAAGTVVDGNVVEVRRNSSAQFSTAVAATLTAGTFSDAFDITTKAQDITPNAFSFIDVTDAEVSTSYTSNAATITGINTATAVSIVGGEYRVNGGSWTSVAGTVVDGDEIEVRRNSSTSHSTKVSATLTVGTYSDAFDITTIAADITPNAFSFIDVTNAEVNTSYTSNPVTITGINTATAISIVGGEYRVNGGGWTSVAGTVVDGDVIEVRRNSSTAHSASVAATLTVGTYSDAFYITTKAADITPNAFIFIDITNADLNTSYTSNAVTITGINTSTTVSIIDGEYRINGGSWTSSTGAVVDGDMIEVRRNSSPSFSAQVSTTLTVGTYNDAFSITTKARDISPNSFSFVDVFDAEINTAYTSNAVTITGINTATPVSILAGEYRINGGAWTTASGTVVDGDVIEVRRNSSTEYSTMVGAMLTVGTYSDSFDITTQDYVPGVNPFTFIDIVDAELDISYISNTITVSGNETAVEVSIVDGEYSINRGEWTTGISTVIAGDMIEVRKTSSTAYETQVSAVLTVGTQSDSFDVTTRGIDDPVDPYVCVDPSSYKKLPPGQIVRRVKDPKIDDIGFKLVIDDQWTTGYCASVHVVNNGNTTHHYPYGVHFNLPEDTQFRYSVNGQETWNGIATREGDKVSVVYPDWQAKIAAGGADPSPFGYCVEGKSEPTAFEHYVPDFDEVSIYFQLTNQWTGGFCGQFKARYDGTNEYSVNPDRFNFRLPTGTDIYESWNGSYVQDGELASVNLEDWIPHLQSGVEVDTFGFCAQGKKLPCNYGTEIENQYTVTFQDGVDGYNGAQDSWVASGLADSNFGSDTSMEADGGSAMNSYANGEGVALMQWNVSSIPQDAIITTAEITVQVTDASAGTYGLYAMNGGWTENTVTWDSANIDANQGKLLAEWDASTTGYHTIKLNFTGVALVEQWLKGGNGGLMIRAMGDTTDGLIINTSEQRKKDRRPVLKVTYRVEEPVSSGSVDVFSFNDVTDAELDQQYVSNSVTITGVSTATDISINGGEYRVNSGVWTNQAQFVYNGDVVEVRRNSSPEHSATVSAVLTVGGVSDSFDITTKAQLGQVCNVSYQSPSVTEQFAQIEASLAGLEYSLEIDSSWKRGYCAHIRVTNTTAEEKHYPYGVQFNLSKNAKVTDSWGGDLQRNGDVATAIFPDWTQNIPANSQALVEESFGFCVTGGSAPDSFSHFIPDFTQVQLTFNVSDQWQGGYCGDFQASYSGNDAYIPSPNGIGFTLDESVEITDSWASGYTRNGSNVIFDLPNWSPHIYQSGSVDIGAGICVVGEQLPCNIESK